MGPGRGPVTVVVLHREVDMERVEEAVVEVERAAVVEAGADPGPVMGPGRGPVTVAVLQWEMDMEAVEEVVVDKVVVVEAEMVPDTVLVAALDTVPAVEMAVVPAEEEAAGLAEEAGLGLATALDPDMAAEVDREATLEKAFFACDFMIPTLKVHRFHVSINFTWIS
ncbi:hypothetical protein QJS04_geneDACA000284 [Acorus gramineus]|uniref:Uncharacterized protein n=1 Tax=Acorus gramineus TaxID=55184 RepID=A0AAV9AQ54_ACOGR|nr:hypothetical protein QJS04_geneDACA000284 [Acorus gramineus]